MLVAEDAAVALERLEEEGLSLGEPPLLLEEGTQAQDRRERAGMLVAELATSKGEGHSRRLFRDVE